MSNQLPTGTTPTRVIRSSSIDGSRSSMIRTALQKDISREAQETTFLVPLSTFVEAMFGQGQRRDDHPDLNQIRFPGSYQHPDADVEGHLPWQNALADRISQDLVWKASEIAVHNATQEADLYKPICNALNVASSMTRATGPGGVAGAVTQLCWVSTPSRYMLLPSHSTSPISKPDLLGVFGKSCAEPGKLEQWAADPNEWNGRISAVDVLVPIEVGFASPNPRPNLDGPLATAQAMLTSASVSLPVGTVWPRGQLLFGGPKAKSTPTSSKSRRSSPASTSKGKSASKDVFGPDVPTFEDPLDDAPIIDSAAIIAHNLHNSPLTSSTTYGPVEPLDKAKEAIAYAATTREVQLFRTGALALAIFNSMVTLIYTTPAGTIISPPVYLFSREFIHILIHMTVADFPQFGYDPLWVTQTRIIGDATDLATADPRNAVDRVLHIVGTTLIASLQIMRRLSVHGRGTTVLLVHPIDHPDLEFVLKCSWVPVTRPVEAQMARNGLKLGVALLEINFSTEVDLEFWRSPGLRLFQPHPMRQLRIICFDRPCTPLGTLGSNKQLLQCLIDAVKG